VYFPEMVKVKLHFPKDCVVNLQDNIIKEISNKNFADLINPNDKVGITVGSRNIQGIHVVLNTLIQFIKKQGATPYLLAAMGSHGGGTPSGQLKILDSMGINEKNYNVTILPDVTSTTIGYINPGKPVSCLSQALKMDKLIIVNRIKPHTSFRGDIESGLFKMLAIGLGGPTGAKYIHHNSNGNMSQLIEKTGHYMLSVLPVVLGLGIVENPYKEIYKIEAFLPHEFFAGEKRLLLLAKSLLPKIPFEYLDLLICEKMGKCFSGTGMDTNIIGRMRINNEDYKDTPQIKRIVVLDLAEESHGNANGIGLADFVTKDLVDKIDFTATYLNCLTTGFLQRGMIPIIMPNDREAIKAAIETLKPVNYAYLKLVRIKNTMDIDNIWVSKALFKEVEMLGLEIEGSWNALTFTKNGKLL